MLIALRLKIVTSINSKFMSTSRIYLFNLYRPSQRKYSLLCSFYTAFYIKVFLFVGSFFKNFHQRRQYHSIIVLCSQIYVSSQNDDSFLDFIVIIVVNRHYLFLFNLTRFNSNQLLSIKVKRSEIKFIYQLICCLSYLMPRLEIERFYRLDYVKA